MELGVPASRRAPCATSSLPDMKARAVAPLVLIGLLWPLSGSVAGQGREIAVPRFPIEASPVELSGEVRPREYVGVVGREAAWLGFETGEAEVWLHPLKAVRDLHLAFRIPEYVDPVEGRDVARTVTVRPAVTTITYAHAAFTVKQHILAPLDRPGILLLLEVETVRPLEILVRFRPALQYAWPAGLGGQYVRWDAERVAFVLSESIQERNVILGSPWAAEASAHPAHRLSEAPSIFTIPVEAARARREFIPVAVAGGPVSREEAWEAYRGLLEDAEGLYRERREHALRLLEETVRLESPDPELDRALQWAKLNLDEQMVCNPELGCGLVAGWGPSGTSARPGFGWFFGGDAAINTLAMDVIGQWEAVAQGLAFLARYRREDGKIPHEISQAAAHIPWFEAYPYAYYHADTTPYWILAAWNHWLASGDDAWLRELWPAVREAYAWCLTAETDGDGIIENTVGGLGAVEVGDLGAELHQDIYLAAVWIEALEAVSELAGHLGETGLVAEADSIRRLARETLNGRYWREDEGHHAFGILTSGGTNDNLTAWPATAAAFGLLDGERADRTLAKLATDSISSDWGARMLSTGSELYDPLHYNAGTVWPFVTGWVSWAQYRYRRPWAGYPLVDAVKRITFDWARGRHAELFSGALYRPLDAAVPHQFFATSMLVTPLLRGMLGWRPDAPRGRAELAPQLPPGWPELAVRNLGVGTSRLGVRFEQRPAGGPGAGAEAGPEGRGRLSARLTLEGPPLRLSYRPSLPPGAREIRAEVNGGSVAVEPEPGLHDVGVELELELGAEPTEVTLSWAGGLAVSPPRHELVPGQESTGLRVVDYRAEGDGWALVVEGEATGTYTLGLHGPGARVASVQAADAGPGAGEARVELAGGVDDDPTDSGARRTVDAEGTAAARPGTRVLRLAFPEGEGRRLLRVRLIPAP